MGKKGGKRRQGGARNRISGGGGGDDENVKILSEEEQDAKILEIAQMHKNTEQMLKGISTMLNLTVALFLAMVAAYQYLHPWELELLEPLKSVLTGSQLVILVVVLMASISLNALSTARLVDADSSAWLAIGSIVVGGICTGLVGSVLFQRTEEQRLASDPYRASTELLAGLTPMELMVLVLPSIVGAMGFVSRFIIVEFRDEWKAILDLKRHKYKHKSV